MNDNERQYAASWALRGLIFFYFASVGVLLPFLPLVFREKGLSTWQIGVLFAIGPLVTMTIQTLWGFISDRLKTVKKIIIFQLVVVSMLSGFVFESDNFYLLLPALFIFYSFAWPVIPLTDSLTLSCIRNIGGNYGHYRLWGSAGFGLTALVCGKLFLTYGVGLFTMVYVVLIIICLIMCVFLNDAVYLGKRACLRDFKQMLTNRDIIIFLLIVTLLSSTNRANDAFMSIFIKSMGGNEAIVGLAWTVAPLAEIPVFALGGLLLSRYSESALMTAAAALFVVRWGLFSVISTPEMIIGAQLFHGVTFGLLFMCAVSYMSKSVPERLRSSGQGLLSCFFGGVAGITGSSLGGLLMSRWGPVSLYTVCTLISTAAFVLFLFRYRQSNAVTRLGTSLRESDKK
ncbi:MAG: hypothetical protein VR69_11235 [Peptococcaceae bacterium BRH_c4b]|nr:MAG: hypothetical protein VR69_11235 [Peptococcaceae bacterium BRH_c4b]